MSPWNTSEISPPVAHPPVCRCNMRVSSLLCGLLILAASGGIDAAPITFNTALPVAKHAFISREQFFSRQFDAEKGIPGRDLDVKGLVSVLGYGITPRLAIFAAVPYLDKTLNLNLNGQRLSRTSHGIGDLKLFARYTFLQHDARSKTFRIAGFAGFKAPTGDDSQRDALGSLPIPLQSGTGAWDGFGGVVLTYQVLDYQIDAQASFRQNGNANGFAMGDEARADVSFQYRMQPREMRSDTRHFLYGVLEANLVNQERNRILGTKDPDSGGTTLYLTPGIQFVTAKYILEAALQLPVLQKLHGNALETDYIFSAGFRINF